MRRTSRSTKLVIGISSIALALVVTGLLVRRGTGVADLTAIARSDAHQVSLPGWAWMAVALIGSALLVVVAGALAESRARARRLRRVAIAARHTVDDTVPRLVEALSDPSGLTPLPVPRTIDDGGTDETAELARSIDQLQATLVETAQRQLDLLERGASDVFVTMVRRTRSLIDRQLTLLDALEAGEEDPETLDHFYRLDQIATRLRRNAESLLVLADSDGRTRMTGSASVDDIVRSAVSEVEDFARVDVLSIAHLMVRGVAVADLTHLLAELLENATMFSPPESRIRVTGDLIDDRYRIMVIDEGIGIPEPRRLELNDKLARPPVIGLAVEPTLGVSVVSLLAGAHEIEVELLAGTPGTIARISLPPSVFERRLVDRPETDRTPVSLRPPRTSDLAPPDIESVRAEPPAERPESVETPHADRTVRRTTRRARRAQRRAERRDRPRRARGRTSKRGAPRRGATRRHAQRPADIGDHTDADTPVGPLTLRLSDLVASDWSTGTADHERSPSQELAALARDDAWFDEQQRRSSHREWDDDEPLEQLQRPASPEPLPQRRRPAPAIAADWDDFEMRAEQFGELGELDITPVWARGGDLPDARAAIPPPPAPAPPPTAPPPPTSSGPTIPPPPRLRLDPPPVGPSASAPLPPPPTSTAPLDAGGPPSSLKAALEAFDLGRRSAEVRPDTRPDTRPDEHGDRT